MVTSPIAPPTTSAPVRSEWPAGVDHRNFFDWASTLLDYWHLLSLDAPTVATVWSCAFAWSAHARVPWLSTAMLALATWLLYVADRLLDGLQESKRPSLQQRHYFHIRHRAAFLAMAAPGLIVLVWFIFWRMDRAARREDLMLGGCALLYLLWVHLPYRAFRSRFIRFPKELAVGTIFAAACVIPAWSREIAARPMLFGPTLLFGALCWMNCVAIEHWEAPRLADGSLVKGIVQQAGITSWMGRHIRYACSLLSGLAVCLAWIAAHRSEGSYAALSLSVAVSGLLTLGLDGMRRRMSALRLRAMADAVLLSPFVFAGARKALTLHFHLLSHGH